MKPLLALALVAVLTGCAASRDSAPNMIQRAKVLSQNKNGITVEHSEWGKPIAFRMADEHCDKLNKSATYLGGTTQMGPNMASTWRCE